MSTNCSLQALKDSMGGGYFSGARPAQDLEASIVRPVQILMYSEWQEKNKGCRFSMQCFITAAATEYNKTTKVLC
jgi:hypothetical protein